MMTIAIPTNDGRLHEHFGGSPQFAFVEAEPAQRKILGTRTVPAPPHTPGLLPLWLREQGAKVLIAGGIGHRALALCAQYGIEVRAGQPGGSPRELVHAYLDGRLTDEPCACHHH